MKFATFSIVAYDPTDDSFGVAVASKFLAVGAYVPYAQAYTGAIATQAFGNTTFGPKGLALISEGHNASETLRQLLANDPGRDERQVGIVDAEGNAATYTGSKCMNWAGGLTGPGFAVQGNILVGAQVVQDMAAAYKNTSGELADRLYAALKAGDDAGGDRRGKQSAALLVMKPAGGYLGMNDRYLDLRVDDHRDPVGEMATLLKLHRLYFGSTPAADKIKLTPVLVRELQGYAGSPVDGVLSDEVKARLNNFFGTENLEERIDLNAGTIDPPALDYLRNRFQ